MYKRLNYGSGAPWEESVGYSRAVRMGNVVEVSGTVAVDDKAVVVGPGNLYLQTRFILKKIEKALAEAGASLSDVVRTRMYVTDIANWEAAGRAHGEVFAAIKPCTTMVEVAALIEPMCLIEIEVTAMIAQP